MSVSSLNQKQLSRSNVEFGVVRELDTKPLDGGGHAAVYWNEKTKDVIAEVMYRGCGCAACGSVGIFRQWLLEPDTTGKIDVKDFMNNPVSSMYARRAAGYLAMGNYAG